MNEKTLFLGQERLRFVLQKVRQNHEKALLLKRQKKAFAMYKKTFSPDGIASLTEQEFLNFTLLANQNSWTCRRRQSEAPMRIDLDLLKEALALLIQEEIPIITRLNELISDEKAMVPGLNRAAITAVLLVHSPKQYGAWNRTVETAMKRLNLWPKLERTAPFGERYLAVNQVLLSLAHNLGIDLRTLNALWRCAGQEEQPSTEEASQPLNTLEEPCQEILDTWDRFTLRQEWEIYEEDGEQVGYKYYYESGEMDLLARHKKFPHSWLLLEWQRGPSDRQVVDRIIRSMDWVKTNLAHEDECVEGRIIVQDTDQALSFILAPFPKIQVLRHQEIFGS